MRWRNYTAIIVITVFGFVLFYMGTDGFRAFTAEAARVQQLTKEKPLFPDVLMEDSEGRTYSFEEFEGKYVFITFMYTSCATVCPILEMNMSEVYKQVPATYIGEDIIFLSISFDPVTDSPARLDRYKDYFQSDGETWRMARITQQSELDALLEAFGVIVIPDGYGNFAHNSAFYLVDRDSRLMKVMDYMKIDEAADTVIELLENGEGSR